MGKKEKKPDKAPPSDVFDPLAVETHQPGTCVLMLDSPEEDVLAKACEAIYKFVEKCDENKKMLLDLGAIDHLLRLIQHDDRIVRRNACMAFGLMTSNADVRKMLRKREEAIPSIVGLLAPEEDTLSHEFAAMALNNMAIDYSSKVAIFENDGMEALIRGLSENDPDVQKNSVEAVGLLLQDFQARAGIKDMGGIPPLLELIQSEFPVIQELALVALERVTQDAENRAALREIDGLGKLVDFIGNPEFSDLHVFAVIVLANCLEDLESVETIKESGGLMKLVAYITDVPAPDDDGDKKKGAKDKSGKGGKDKKDAEYNAEFASRAGFYNKLDNSLYDKHKGGKDDGDVIPTLPDVKQYASMAIGRAAKSTENKKVLHEAEVEKMFIHLFSHEDAKVQIAAAEALAVMAEFGLSRDCISGWEGIEPLVKMLKKEDQQDVVCAASLALANLTNGSQNNVSEIVNFGGIESLISLLSNGKGSVISNVCAILTNMSNDEEVRTEVQKAGVISGLIEPLKSSNPLVQSHAAMAVAAFVGDAEYRAEFRNLGGIESLVQMLRSGSDSVRRNAAWSLSVCAVDEPTAMAIATQGGLEVLQELQLSSTRRNAFTDAALDRLLNHNLSAKYSLTGFLGSSNLITDGFYDSGRLNRDQPVRTLKNILEDDVKLFQHVDTDRILTSMNNIAANGFYDAGALKPGTKFAPLEALCKKELDQKRPVILINAEAEPVHEPLPEIPKYLYWPRRPSTPKTPDTIVPSKDESKPGKAISRSGRDSKSPDSRKPNSKSRTAKEKDLEKREKEEEELQRQKEAEEAAAKEAEKVFNPPADPQLIKYIDEVVEKIMPLASTRQQVISLAEYVSSKMGGAIARGQLSQFSWELPISQLKYERKSNVLPIGCIKAGIHVHRALLFKVLADRIGVGCTLERGDYNRAWNTVLLFDEDAQGNLKFPPKGYIVDLVHEPGNLLRSDTGEAEQYKRL